jgi:DNA repair exonuclease SbcCD nuclease subunit
MKKLRLIHTSDTHLGDPAGHPRADKVLELVVEAVERLEGDALLLAGDVFDNERVTDEVLERFVGQMAQLDVPVIVLPGNHDLAHNTSVYGRAPFEEAPANLRVIRDPEGETLAFPELDLELWGRAMLSHTPDFRPLDGMPEPTEGQWLVAMAHGHFHFENDRDQRSSPIYPEDVAASACHYLALGHWDRHADVSRADTTAVYSGCPYGPIGAPEQGAVCVVDLDPDTGVSYRLELLNRQVC